ncbi:MAG TPA: hypothetical protein PLX54_10355 [Candidatus Fermentibacter daniensis]|mgnify:CR=1 FL=1|nr:hypothetical protein [Candidatus Fermentibacter daniensis]HPK52746.1 hypothetical protein [Candidatus Fermentibacter daniensis]
MGKLEFGILLLGKKGAIKAGFKQLEIGEMLQLKLDGKRGTISFSADLTGEEAPINLEASYRLTEKDGISLVEVKSLSIDREWMNQLAHLLLAKHSNRIPIPNGSEKYLKLLK